ncbi:hypothetical protein HBB16_00085 [Pseudonocardia sp. MCCB 268]|nr:hypothetical protein [Pseudonocardia cytotoxica]
MAATSFGERDACAGPRRTADLQRTVRASIAPVAGRTYAAEIDSRRDVIVCDTRRDLVRRPASSTTEGRVHQGHLAAPRPPDRALLGRRPQHRRGWRVDLWVDPGGLMPGRAAQRQTRGGPRHTGRGFRPTVSTRGLSARLSQRTLPAGCGSGRPEHGPRSAPSPIS